MSLSHIQVPQFKSPFRAIARSLFLSRSKHKAKNQKQKERNWQLEAQNQRLINENRILRRRVEQLEREKQDAIGSHETETNLLPADPRLYRHHFGSRLIAMCCELAKAVGFRSSESVLTIVRRWLGVDFKIPSHSTIRSWLCRIGVALLDEGAAKADDWIWLADHSIQLGDLKVFVVLGIRHRDLPQGRALCKEDMTPLALLPDKSRKKEEVAAAFQQLAEKIGVPLSIVIDGASELHEGAKCFKDSGKDVVILDDIKHKAANILKRELGQDARFKEFDSKIGQTTASIQQTELAHFLPPKKKSKCRFMNLSKLLDWHEMGLHHVHHPAAKGNHGINHERVKAKLAWLTEFEVDLTSWKACQMIVSATLKFTNSCGIYRGATEALKRHLGSLDLPPEDPLCTKVQDALIDAVWQCEQRLVDSSHASSRFPISTEVLESTFAAFKQLQKNHIRGTFTSLLAALPTLLFRITPESAKRHLLAIDKHKLKDWVTNAKLGSSTQARKVNAYRETKPQKKRQPRQKNAFT